MAREMKPSPARTRARAPNRLRSSTQRNPDVRKFDRPRRAKKRRPLRTIPSGGRTNNPPGWIRSHHDRKSLSKFVFSVKTTPRIKRKNATPIRATKSGRRSGNARAAGGIGLRAEKAEGAVGTGAAGVGGRMVRQQGSAVYAKRDLIIIFCAALRTAHGVHPGASHVGYRP